MLLRARALACIRAEKLLFSGLSFASEPGYAMALTGPNGIGKSSLLRLIAGLLPVHAGTVELVKTQGARVLAGTGCDMPLGQYCHYLGHRDALKPSMSVIETLDFWSAFLGPLPASDHGKTQADISENAEKGAASPESPPLQPLSLGDTPPATPISTDAALERVGLSHLADLPCQLLSAGQRRRLTLARLLVVARPLWLLDEPTTALDSAGQDILWHLCASHLDNGGVVMVATHAPLPVPNRIVALDRVLS
jgi:heme exporter protein A